MKKKCSVENCGNDCFSKTLCRKHHTRWLRNGTTESLYDLQEERDPLDGIKDTRPGHRGNYAINIINDIKFKARARKKDWKLTHRQVYELIKSCCFYCGFVPKWPEERVGIDRVDNQIGYEPGNCVPCCFICNSAKGRLGKDAFRQWIIRLYEHHCKS